MQPPEPSIHSTSKGRERELGKMIPDAKIILTPLDLVIKGDRKPLTIDDLIEMGVMSPKRTKVSFTAKFKQMPKNIQISKLPKTFHRRKM